MGKLHEVLAAEPSLKGTAHAIINETVSVFKNGDRFDGLTKVWEALEENNTRQIRPEESPVVTTVNQRLEHMIKEVAPAIDITLTKEMANSSGRAVTEVEIMGVTHTLSATALMALEKHLKVVRGIADRIPTLDEKKIWSLNEQTGQWVTTPIEKTQTEKRTEPIVKYEATERHPAQTELITRDVPVYSVVTTYKSGRWTSAEKARVLANIDSTIVKVVEARCRANDVEVEQTTISESMLKALFGL